ncbi:hypothetical protein J0A67_11800 [Algoriphagus aestuariicola]|uniref:PH domain-containing protein n=1 Tax=Algoriphagus aestuariicola TaxID=1852016 RepID=A0ABS3BQI5_9BACT|nr:hypothetical protein [Algoriphagus aestuariicola]MBN7801550.1 hypothetical protein [Algoriphagus aestuariicola]
MIYSLVSILAIAFVFFVIAIFLTKTNTSGSIDLDGWILTIRYPFKTAKINLRDDLEKWGVRKINMLWRGMIFVLSLKLTTGETKKIYFRSRSGSVRKLIRLLEELALDGRIAVN